MALIRLEDLWKERLVKRQWSERAAIQISLCLAPSTLKLYNYYIHDFYLFCVDHQFSFPPSDTVALSDYLCLVADSSTKPRSKLKTICAALSCFYEASELLNVVHNPDIVRLIQALIKSGTSNAFTHSKVMPVEKFNTLFTQWGENDKLSIKQLRQKANFLH